MTLTSLPALAGVLFLVGALAVPAAPTSAQGVECHGCNGYCDGGIAAAFPYPPCSGTPLEDWSVSVMIEAFNGACAMGQSETFSGCLEAGCSALITYSWGSEASQGPLVLGGYKPGPGGFRRTFSFPDGTPWVPGEAGSWTYNEEGEPLLGCDSSYFFYIQGTLCDIEFHADLEVICTDCVPIGQ